MATLTSDAVGVRHPLEPLSVDEIAAAVRILRSHLSAGMVPSRFIARSRCHTKARALRSTSGTWSGC